MHGCTNANWIKLLQIIDQFNQQGGPQEKDYLYFNTLLNEVHRAIKIGSISEEAVSQIRHALKDALSTETMQGRGLQKKYGYSGDFAIINDIHQHTITQVPHLRSWDEFFHAQSAPKAVRNRKDYFIEFLEKQISQTNKPISLLNIASGPCRDLYEFFERNPEAKISVDCVDTDPFSINYAKLVCQNYLDKVSFHHSNAFKFNTTSRYDLIWSAGLFDYFDNNGFIALLKHLTQFANHSAKIVIGNFSKDNPSQAYMEIVGDWFLHYRDAEELAKLAHQVGYDPKSIYVEKEAEDLNLFLHITHLDSMMKTGSD